jgi:hypothetical protein
MRRCEDVKLSDRPPLLEEPFAQTLSGKNRSDTANQSSHFFASRLAETRRPSLHFGDMGTGSTLESKVYHMADTQKSSKMDCRVFCALPLVGTNHLCTGTPAITRKIKAATLGHTIQQAKEFSSDF